MMHPGMSVADQILDLTHCPLKIDGRHPDDWRAWVDEDGGTTFNNARLRAEADSLDAVLTALLKDVKVSS